MVQFTYPPTYPDVPPETAIVSHIGLSDEQEEEISRLLQEQVRLSRLLTYIRNTTHTIPPHTPPLHTYHASHTTHKAEENVGMVMVFTLVSAVQEKLGEMVEAVRSERRREKERKEEEEKRKEEVTVSCYTSCKIKDLFPLPMCISSCNVCPDSVEPLLKDTSENS